MHKMMIAALVAQAFRNEASESGNDAGGGAPAFQVSIPEKVESWLALGKTEGGNVQALIGKGESYARDVLLVYGEYLKGEEASRTDFLTGYASGWSNPATGKVRKSEAKAVFDAFSMHDAQRELVVGYDKEKKLPIKESRTIGEWLKMHGEVAGHGGYMGLVKLAKTLRGAASGQGAGGGASKRTQVMTDLQHKEITEKLAVANSHQAQDIVQKATAQLTRLPAGKFEQVLFSEISMICNQIKMKSQDKGHVMLAATIFDMVEEALARISADALKASGDQPKAPAPAETPQAEIPQATGTNG